NQVQGAAVWYSTSTLNPGDIVEIPLQGDAHTLATGRYSWSFSVTANYFPTPVTTTQSGFVNIINDNGSLFGAGWTLAGFDRLWAVTGGVILEMAAGRSLWFASNGQGGFVTPAGDFSTLVQNADSTYTRTLKDGTKYNFSSAGRLTSIADRNNNALTMGYDGQNRLSTITDFTSLVTTLTYNAAGRVSTIVDPANRSTA